VAGLKKLLNTLLEWVGLIGFSFVLAILINLFIMQPIKVEGKSMYPTLHDNDFVLLSRIGKTLHLNPKYGDIIVVDHRTDRERSLLDDLSDIRVFHRMESRDLWIKRLIGKPGDVIEIRAGAVYRNGKLLEEPYLLDKFTYGPDERFVVPEDCVFVMGDNRNNSMDSRKIGFIPCANIKGTMMADISRLLR